MVLLLSLILSLTSQAASETRKAASQKRPSSIHEQKSARAPAQQIEESDYATDEGATGWHEGTKDLNINYEELYFAAAAVDKPECENPGHARNCKSNIEKLDCHWANAARINNATCTYVAKGGAHQITGRKATRLARAVSNTGLVEMGGAAGQIGFATAQNLGCKETTQGRMKPSYDCSIAEYAPASCLSEEDRKELNDLKAKARRKNCLTGRGAANCMSAQDQARTRKLEARQAAGCRSEAEGRRFGRDVKPTMEAE